jgi:hypothetical protein
LGGLEGVVVSSSAGGGLGGGFAAFIAFGLVMRAGLLLAGGAAFLATVFGKSITSSWAFAIFFVGPPPVASSFGNLFCWVSVSIILGAGLGFAAGGALEGDDLLVIRLLALISSSPISALPRFC